MSKDHFKSLTSPGAVNRILVRATNWIGDAVMTTPALMALRAGFPNAHIAVLAKPAVAELLQNHPAVDEIVVYRSPGAHAGWGGKLSLVRLINRGRYDLAVLFQNAFEAALVTMVAGIPNRYGYTTDGRLLLLTHRVPLTPEIRRKHQVDYYLELLRPLEIAVPPAAPMLHTTAGEDTAAVQFLQVLGVGPHQCVIGLNPGATYGTAKRWLPERYAQVADRLALEYEAHVLIFGGRGEETLGQEITRQMSSAPVTVLSGKTTIRQLMALIKQCRLFITNDSGPMHIAKAFGVPLVAIFGPTDPVTTSPYGTGYELVRKAVDCSPCLLRECPIDHRCMRGISVDDVHAAAERQMPTHKSDKGKASLNEMDQKSSLSPFRTRVVFLDRDGTLNFDPGYLHDPHLLHLLPGVGKAIARLNGAGLATVVVSNQSGVGRGLIEAPALEAIHRRLRELLAADGATLDGIYVCTHRPEEGCTCRKPAPGLVLKARQDLGLPADGSIVIGDKASDMELARNVGATAVFVLSGEHPDEERLKMAARGLVPDFTAINLGEAVEWVLKDLNVHA